MGVVCRVCDDTISASFNQCKPSTDVYILQYICVYDNNLWIWYTWFSKLLVQNIVQGKKKVIQSLNYWPLGNPVVTHRFPKQRLTSIESVYGKMSSWYWVSLLYPPQRSWGGVYWIHPVRPSVCLSVCPSVRPSVGRCPDDNSNSFQWI